MIGPLGYSELNIENYENQNKIEKLRNEITTTNKLKKPKKKKELKNYVPINSDSESDTDYSSNSDIDMEEPVNRNNNIRSNKINTKENFTEMPSEYAKQYYNQYIPFTDSTVTNDNNSNMDLLKKLNYMIHLLEDQKDEKVEGITEELVLFSFLGIFIIFIIDSFTKVGKYIR